MTESSYRPAQINVLDKGVPMPKYLPGQRSLFAEEPAFEVVSTKAESLAGPSGELFYTGKDLPGKHETDQVILWDVA